LTAQATWRAGLSYSDWGRKLAVAALIAAMQMLAGGPETILLTWMLLFTLACRDWLLREGSRTWLWVRFAGIGVLVAVICAAQLLPFLQLLFDSQRDTGFGASSA